MFLCLLFLLIISSALSYFFGFFLGKNGIFFTSSSIITICWLIVIYYFSLIIFFDHSVIFIDLGIWFNILYLDVRWLFLLDSLSVTMLLIIFTISMCVHIYSCYYMNTDVNSNKFMSYLTLFTLFMTLLVISSNFLILFLGWEGVGLCSFLLISFWNTRVQANKSAIKAMLINRIGDFFLLVAIIILAIVFKTLDFYVIFSLVHVYSLKTIIVYKSIKISVVDLICLLLLLGAITKSAQLGFHGWSPDAMEGPTPVSALIHAATMVTAGVFLIIRCSYLFEFSDISLTILVYISSLTIVLFGLVGLAQYDIKKIIAYSTCSQLGYMMLACSLSGYNLALYHLFTHASFKALLFLSAGTIIHTMNNEQDIRKLNGIFNVMPLTSILFLIGSLSLIGFPYLSGFYSKDAIIELSFFYEKNFLIYIFTLLGVFLTTMYSFKILYYIFFKKNFNSYINKNILNNYHFSFLNFVPLIFLSLLSIFSGYFTKTLFIGLGNNIFYGSILVLMNDNVMHSEFLHNIFKLLNIPIIFYAIFIFLYLYLEYFNKNTNIYFLNYNLFLFFNKRMFFDSLMNLFISFVVYKNSYKIFYLFDKGLLELFGPNGLLIILDIIKQKIFKNLQAGYLPYVLMHVGFIVLVLLLSFLYLFFKY